MEIKNFRVEGLRELERLMIDGLPATSSRKVALAAMREAAKPMQASAKRKARKRSGALAESIGFKSYLTRRTIGGGKHNTFARLSLGPMSGNARAWAKYVAYYQKPIKVTARNGNVETNIGRMRHSHLIEFGFNHARSGKKIPPMPYLRPAFDEESSGYMSTYRRILKKKVDAAIRKHNARSPAK
jgi:hypothetical protein